MVVICGRDGQFAQDLLDWAGCLGLWQEHRLAERFEVAKDVLLELTDGFEYERQPWSTGKPGEQGYDHAVEIHDVEQVRSAIRARVQALASRKGGP